MTDYTKLLLAAVAPASLLAALPAQAQSVAVADPEAAVTNTKAFAAATQQIQTTYKAQLDQATARRTAAQAELQPLLTALDTNRDGNLSQDEIAAAQAAKRPELASVQQKQAAAQADLARLEGPASRAQQYALEQISAKLQAAVQSAVSKHGVTLLLKPAAAMYALPAADITSAITAELDATVPSVSTTPPAGWQPGQGGQGAPASAPAAPATGKKPTGGR